ncbi:GrpB family protein [Microbacterium thalli]|uniref:GrpB family protein n=1 Tax=Microbacterium thalli TaxID=3027921 RepID=UPI0023667D0E|nr:GrpB family protein [Microbacterium thalli]MDD7930326.1 GrpB family protein [Microbacterium thalli]
MTSGPDNPARLSPHDPTWAETAQSRLDDVSRALAGLPGADRAHFDHIGSTAVADLDAKPIIDLQVRIVPLPSEEELSLRLGAAGFRRAWGSRPDSPGVFRDIPRGGEPVPDEVWEKRLFVSDGGGVILHIRRADSPWGRATVSFRDRLRADPVARERYQQLKRRLSVENAGKADYDDYTRAKTRFFDDLGA